MKCQFWLWLVLCCYFFPYVTAAKDEGVIDHSNANHQNGMMTTLSVRQCSCNELQQCFHDIWGEFKCAYKGGSSSTTRRGSKGLEFLDQCSNEKIRGFCSANGNEFITINDVGYIETKDLPERNEQLCFNENMIKCFKVKGCDIPSHNSVLKKIHFGCMKASMKHEIQLMLKYSELVTAEQINKAKMEFLKQYNETFVAENGAYRNNMVNVVSIVCFVIIAFMM